MKFATRMMKVSNEAKINVKVDPQTLIKKYEKEIKQLKQELVNQSGVMSEKKSSVGFVGSEDYTFEEKKFQYKMAKEYLRGEIDDLEIESIAHAKSLIQQFRKIYSTLTAQMKDIDNYRASEDISEIMNTSSSIPLGTRDNNLVTIFLL